MSGVHLTSIVSVRPACKCLALSRLCSKGSPLSSVDIHRFCRLTKARDTPSPKGRDSQVYLYSARRARTHNPKPFFSTASAAALSSPSYSTAGLSCNTKRTYVTLTLSGLLPMATNGYTNGQITNGYHNDSLLQGVDRTVNSNSRGKERIAIIGSGNW